MGFLITGLLRAFNIWAKSHDSPRKDTTIRIFLEIYDHRTLPPSSSPKNLP